MGATKFFWQLETKFKKQNIKDEGFEPIMPTHKLDLLNNSHRHANSNIK